MTRLVSRVGTGRLSGVDRVEAAYLRHALDRTPEAFGLVRTHAGYLLLGQDGLARLRQGVEDSTKPWDAPDLLSRLARHRATPRARVESSLRKLAVGRSVHWGLARMLRRALPEGAHYLNVGETNLTDRVISALRRLPGSRIDVVLHDTIPLDLPEMVTPASRRRFAARFDHLRRDVDRIITATEQVKTQAMAHLGTDGTRPDWCVAPFGLDLATPETDAAATRGLSAPYFLALGTLEPRKNLELLLDTWRLAAAELGPAVPTLVLCGARGWLPPEAFAALEANPLYGRKIVEINGASDHHVAGLMSGAQALLFPTRAEGFGFPALEAAARGVPVICSDLPVFRETLGTLPVYLSPDDSYAWLSIIKQAGAKPEHRERPDLTERFTWERHFAQVFG
ncbi:glycosyltransferase family 4 protein [Dinoroseobacter sp. S375]|uniref:glycosyltransferase family 4 protein n=1 Tax=Dinoroseobacter sp. S375 TaxID=3415136 RepID=UPI003C7CCCAF